MTKYPTFDEILQSLHFPKNHLRVEKIITTSMNNYVVNINCSGITWALVMRYPKHIDAIKFIKEKEYTMQNAAYLASLFETPIQIGEHDYFTFIGKSYLVDASSIKKFMTDQRLLPPLKILNAFHNEEKMIAGITIPDDYISYNGPYFITRGAPANETLEDDFSFAELFLKSLAVLHVKTGAKQIVKYNSLQDRLEKAYKRFSTKAIMWEPCKDSSEEKRIIEYTKNYGKDMLMYIKQEVYLQSNQSTEYMQELLVEFFPKESHNDQFMSFVHGDMHGANFIIVQYEYSIDKEKKVFLDRTLLNTIFKEHPTVTKVTIEQDEDEEQMVYRKYEKDDEEKKNCVIAYREKRNEIHIIDIDTATGVIQPEKQCYLLDVLVCAFSVKNWSHIHQQPLTDFSDIVKTYTTMFENILQI